MTYPTDKKRLKRMCSLGVRWRKGRAIPTYPATMTEQQKAKADQLYDAMSDAFVDAQGVKAGA